MQRTLARASGWWLLVCALACGKDAVEVRDKNKGRSSDYGQSALVEAANALSADPASPAAYRTFREKVAELADQFSEAVAEEAERYLVFLALGPLEAVADQSREEQLEALALTVWPTVFGVQPREDESPREYLEEVCESELATECKHMVPDFWPVMLGALVWTRLKERAHVAYRSCGECTDDPGYTTGLAKFDQHQAEWSALAGKSQECAHPKSWPVAGENARPWSDPPLLARDLDGKLRLNGDPLARRDRLEALAKQRGEGSVLGLYVSPRQNVQTLRALMSDAAAAGYGEVALLALDAEYPYEKKEYRLALGRRAKGRAVNARDTDTVQVLIQALDAASASAEGPLRLK